MLSDEDFLDNLLFEHPIRLAMDDKIKPAIANAFKVVRLSATLIIEIIKLAIERNKPMNGRKQIVIEINPKTKGSVPVGFWLFVEFPVLCEFAGC